MALKNIPDPGFADDTGAADPALAEALASWHADRTDPDAEPAVLRALRKARLLVPVVAVLGESTTDASGLRRDKSSDMAVPTLTAAGGRRALPAFTSTDALNRWREDARPVAVRLPQVLQALAQEEADTLVLDLAGPVTYQLTGPALRALAEGRSELRPGRDPDVVAALRAILAAEPDVAGAHLLPGGADCDATLALALTPGAEAAATARRLSGALTADGTLRARLVHGLALALLPSGSALPEGAFFVR
ncbi:SseB protein N-terminal domain-containing protein [Streptomyces sp. WMMB 714]|uniref:SseB family protein n=1 Tax=Streptomyces sp. WMMB 714 TaxID=1286822 RepID=UPI0005F7F898|nr:SseB family protein [Streptomyces sp. WMMB 714]SCK41617.1 SseB protein N-terminal domain-containing protein [Streptomyces sp. WMMB 714]